MTRRLDFSSVGPHEVGVGVDMAVDVAAAEIVMNAVAVAVGVIAIVGESLRAITVENLSILLLTVRS